MPEEVTSNEKILSDDEKNQRIDELRRTIEENELLNLRTDDVFLIRYLSCCDWNVAEAYVRITKLFKLKFENPKWFFNRQLNDYKDILNQNAKFMLQGRDKKGRRVYLSRMSQASKLNLIDLAQLDDLWLEAMLNEKDTIENGIVALLDMSGYSFKMLRWLTPGNVRVASAKADLMPIKNMEVHVINSSSLLNKAVSIVFPMLSQSIKEQIFFHGNDFDSLHKHTGREVLPAEYGGTLDNINFDDLHNYLHSYQDIFNNSISLGYTSDPSKCSKQTNGKKGKIVIDESI